MDNTYNIDINYGLAYILSVVNMKICPYCKSNNIYDVDGYILGCNNCNNKWSEDET